MWARLIKLAVSSGAVALVCGCLSASRQGSVLG